MELALPLLRGAALLSEPTFHPLLNRLSEMSVNLALGAASLTSPECKSTCTMTGGCWGYQYCPDPHCFSAGCGVDCQPLSGQCETGGSCWAQWTGNTCCDCYCCPPGMPCFACICHGPYLCEDQ